MSLLFPELIDVGSGPEDQRKRRETFEIKSVANPLRPTEQVAAVLWSSWPSVSTCHEVLSTNFA